MKAKMILGVAAAGILAVGAAFLLLDQAEPRRVLFIDSYHAGYEWSDGITAGSRCRHRLVLRIIAFSRLTEANRRDRSNY